MKQEEMLDKIRRSAESVPTPASLEPEQMMKKLDQTADDNKSSRNIKSSKKIWGYGGLAAAVLAVCIMTQLPNRALTGAGNPEHGQQEQMLPPEEGKEADQPGLANMEELADTKEDKEYLVSSYEELYDQIQKQASEGCDSVIYDTGMGNNLTETGAAPGEAAAGGAPLGNMKPDSAKMEVTSSNPDGFSETNIQVQGVDEGDLVKTDGTYIYVSTGDRGKIQIIKAAGKNMEVVGRIADTSTVRGAKHIEEFYINGQYITVIRMDYGSHATFLETYDLKNPKEPKLLGSVKQDGYYKESRRNGDYVYLFTDYYAEVDAGKDEIERYVPKIDGSVIPLNCIYLPETPSGTSYLVASSLDMKNPGQVVQSKAVYSEGDQFYVSQSNIYIGNTTYDYKAEQYDYTELLKFSYKDGKISFYGHGNVDGYLNNQFSMDEYEGNLRLVTTLSHQSGQQTNSLIILDNKLKKLSEIEDLAPGEQIYSARFMGDTAYFVTFRNMDPLFSADLSNPKNPKILGELKITGFSEYLHPYSDGLLLGIGREISPDTGNFKGLKLSMFDTNDPSDVKERDKMVEKTFEYTPAWENHKSVVISAEKNLIGFAVEEYNKDRREWLNQYVVYSYEKDQGFTRRLTHELAKDRDQSQTRGLYIGEWFYVVEEDKITVFDMAHFNEFGHLNY